MHWASRCSIPRGLWLNLGLGYGSVDCGNACTMGAPTGEVSAGWALSPRFLLGAAFLGGLGCDFRITPHVSLTPFADFSAVRAWSANDLRADLWRLDSASRFTRESELQRASAKSFVVVEVLDDFSLHTEGSKSVNSISHTTLIERNSANWSSL